MKRSRFGAFEFVATLAAALAIAGGARAHDETRYPEFRGQWSRTTPGAQWDSSKPGGLRQQAPLTPEYQAIFEANISSLTTGRQVYNAQAKCLPSGMPRMMIAYEPMEFIVTPETTYIRFDHLSELRRIHTDGRDWPAKIPPAFTGYSIGRWIDEDGDGRYDALTVETRGFKGPRMFEATGLPLHKDNESVIEERLFLDKADKNLMHNQIITTDHALTRPWAVEKTYRREANPAWFELICAEANNHVVIGTDSYFKGADGYLMPTRKDQAPPDLRYFDAARP